MRIGIIGGGKVGSCLGEKFGKAGLLSGITAASPCESAALARRFGTASFTNDALLKEADLVLLTVPDRLIAPVAAELAQNSEPYALKEKCVLHCSGSLGLDVLQPLAEKGASVGSLHPLQSFAGGRTDLTGVYMAVDGDEKAESAACELAAFLGGRPFHVPAAERAAYHAAACFCSNYAVTTAYLAQQLMSRWTGSEEKAWQALLPLFNGTADNLRKAPRAQAALTGPIARGDAATVAAHLAALPKNFRAAYRILGLSAAAMALANGTIDARSAEELTELLRQEVEDA